MVIFFNKYTETAPFSGAPEFIPVFSVIRVALSFSFLFSVLYILFCPFVLLSFALSVLRFKDIDYSFWYLQTLLIFYKLCRCAEQFPFFYHLHFQWKNCPKNVKTNKQRQQKNKKTKTKTKTKRKTNMNSILMYLSKCHRWFKFNFDVFDKISSLVVYIVHLSINLQSSKPYIIF